MDMRNTQHQAAISYLRPRGRRMQLPVRGNWGRPDTRNHYERIGFRNGASPWNDLPTIEARFYLPGQAPAT